MSQNGDGPVIERRNLGPNPDNDDVVTAILETITAAREESEMPETPLYESVDTEALTSLFDHPRNQLGPVVYFVASECDVLVSSDGTVLARQRKGQTGGDHPSPDALDALFRQLTE